MPENSAALDGWSVHRGAAVGWTIRLSACYKHLSSYKSISYKLSSLSAVCLPLFVFVYFVFLPTCFFFWLFTCLFVCSVIGDLLFSFWGDVSRTRNTHKHTHQHTRNTNTHEIHTHTDTRTQTHRHQTHGHIQWEIHRHTDTRAQTHRGKYTHTHTHTHTQNSCQLIVQILHKHQGGALKQIAICSRNVYQCGALWRKVQECITFKLLFLPLPFHLPKVSVSKTRLSYFTTHM